MSDFLAGVAHDLPGLHAELGAIVTYTPAGGTARQVTVIPGRGAAPVEFPELEVDGTRRWLRAIDAALPELAQGDAFRIGADDYTVTAIERDRAGTVLAMLTDAP